MKRNAMPAARKTLIACFVAAIVACQAGDTSGAREATTAIRESEAVDSAGVRIVNNVFSIESLPIVRISEEAIYRVGHRPDDPQFTVIVGGTLLSDGQAVVAEWLNSYVTMLDPSGRLVRTWGGTGQGPGEFHILMSVTAIRGDTVIVQDPGNQRLSFFFDGELIRTLRVPIFPAVRVLSGDGGGSVFLGSHRYAEPVRGPGEWAMVPLVRLDLRTGLGDTIAYAERFERPTMFDDRGRSIRGAFPGMGYSDAWSGGFVKARYDRPEVVWLDSGGRTVQIARWSGGDVPVTDAMLDQYVAYYRDANEEYLVRRPLQEVAERISKMREHAKSILPHVWNVFALEDGQVWVGEYAIGPSPLSYRVFDDKGHMTHRVELPHPMYILDIRPPWILAMEEDELDAPMVVLYSIDSVTPSASR